MNIHADKLQPGSLGAVGYDDEGVKCGEWDLVKDGVLVNFQAIRDQAHILGLQAFAGLLLCAELGRRAIPADAECLAACPVRTR
jgi:hypothetical protein